MTARYRVLLLLPVALAACVGYRPQPLPENPGLAAQVPRLSAEAEHVRVPGVTPHPFDPSDGLDEVEVAMLAVANNPGLRAERARAGIGRAQLFAAGLLPDPVLRLGAEHPLGDASGLTPAFGLGLDYPLRALVTRGAARTSAAARLEQLDLQVLWQEWQVAQQARLLFVRAVRQERLRTLLTRYRERFRARDADASRLVEAGDLTAGDAAAVLAARLGVDTRLNRVERRDRQVRDALAGLLGLDPGVEPVLAGDPPVAIPNATDIETALAGLPDRRPDLLALRAGYASQDARLRRAILEQFPAVGVGVRRNRDTDGVHTVGFGITLRLPFLSGNRGAIAVEQATRGQLREDYRARLAEARVEVRRMGNGMRLLERQRTEVRARLPELERMAAKARAAFDEGNLDLLTYLAVERGLLERQVEALQLEQSLDEASIGMQTMLGIPLRPRP